MYFSYFFSICTSVISQIILSLINVSCYFWFERPVGVPHDHGCALVENDGDPNFDIRSSLSLPINVIDSGKVCHFLFLFGYLSSTLFNCVNLI